MRVLSASLALLAGAASATAAEEMRGPGDGCVVVTGATGFVGGHITKLLLEKGYTVHGTVRSLYTSTNHRYLEKLAAKTPGTLKLFRAGLEDKDPFTEVVKGCWGFFHVASLVIPDRDTEHLQVDLSINGTLSALEAAKAGGLSTVVLTASTATIAPNTGHSARGEPSDESDWNDKATPSYGRYAYSKVRAEKTANAWMIKNGHPFRLTTIHFPLAIGPQLEKRVTTSNAVVSVLMRGALPLVPPMQWNVVDIRDVARAHVLLMENPRARGRYIVAIPPKVSSLSVLNMSQILLKHFPDYPIPSVEMPIWFARFVGLFDLRLDSYTLDIAVRGRHPGYDGTKITRELGFEYQHTNTEQTLVDAANSMIEFGIADGWRHLLRPVIAFAIAPFLLAFVIYLISKWTCCAPSGPKRKTD